MSLDALPADIVVERDAATISFGATMRYGDLAAVLADEGLALHNLASLPHISVAGAVATATHGSGDTNGNLATAVAALEMVTSEGDIVTARRGDEDFDGMVVGLGTLGAVTRITLDVGPAYEVRQRVFEGLSYDASVRSTSTRSAPAATASASSHAGGTPQTRCGSRAGSRKTPRSSSAISMTRPRRRSSGTPSSASTRSTAPSSSGAPAPGPTACPTSAWASRRAPARSCSPSSCSRGATLCRRSMRCAPWATGSRRSSRSARSARSPPTPCG